MKQTFKCFVAALVAMFAVVIASAQVTTSSISGRVADSEGAVVGAAVVATHVPSGTNYYSITDNILLFPNSMELLEKATSRP